MQFSQKLIKNSFVVLTLGAALTLPFVSAQAAPGDKKSGDNKPGEWRGRRGGGRMDRMSKELGLTEKQKASMRKVMQESRAKREKIRNDRSLSDSQKRAKMEANHKETRKKMNAILTPAQRKKAEKMRDEWRKEHPRGGGFGGPGGPRGPHRDGKKPA